MRGLRLKFMLFVYNWSTQVYSELFKGHVKAWGISKEEFLTYPVGSIGAALGAFYQEKGFDVMPKLENHDVFHILTETGTAIHDEIAMQYLLFGNGKISLYLLGMLLIGTLLFPEHGRYYLNSFRKGKRMQRFYDIAFKDYLLESRQAFQLSLYNKTIHTTYNTI